MQLDRIKQNILKARGERLKSTAAFDADGTLWPVDVGRDFFQYQIRKNLLDIPHPQREFDRCLQMDNNRRRALTWLALNLKGRPLEQVKGWVQNFLKDYPLRVFDFQKELIFWLVRQGVRVFVVSSSVQWVLEEVIQSHFPCIPPENIIGVKTGLKQGVITGKLVEPTPVQDEKVPSLLRQSGGRLPVFAAGNTMSDLALLKSARVQMAISTAGAESFNYESEKNLQSHATKNKWFVYRREVKP